MVNHEKYLCKADETVIWQVYPIYEPQNVFKNRTRLFLGQIISNLSIYK